MEQMSRTEITNRLGKEPEMWDFFGQVYDTGANNSRVCALTHETTRICFTIKPRSGKGRMTISDKAIAQFERWNPDLYIKLHTGLMFLQVHNKAVDASIREQETVSRIRSAEKRYNAVKRDARRRIDHYRQTIKKGALPDYLQAMKDLLQRPSPYFQGDDARALWFEQNTVAMEKVIFSSPDETVAAAPVAAPQPKPEPVSIFSPIPEIDF